MRVEINARIFRGGGAKLSLYLQGVMKKFDKNMSKEVQKKSESKSILKCFMFSGVKLLTNVDIEKCFG